MFNSLLIANRGEIAVRIAKTAHRLGIEVIAVYSDGDGNALHVEAADKAYPLKGERAADTYLDGEKILALAQLSGAEAIHPGYGFLSENADFAHACESAGITFIGPSADAIRQMGSKSAAKRLMAEAGVPLVPGYHGDAQDFNTLSKAASDCGYPIMLKASAGGGGKGMRVVATVDDLPTSLESVKRESLASFGDDHILIEKYITAPRHIEIQIFGDTLGNHVHLFERDCSIQRRHQKVVEEAPAPGMSEQWRESMGQAAIKAAKAIDYTGAGTIEFIVDEENNFYFMEMNTRLQVEHPVTECVTSTDLVEWQFLVAAGEKLPQTQEALTLTGHSIEARIYAEDTDAGFLPASGHIDHVDFPQHSQNCRIGTGVKSGDTISINFDPMIAKIVSFGEDRDSAIQHLQKSLSQTNILGLTTNLPFLKRILGSAQYHSGNINTDFIHDNEEVLQTQPIEKSEKHEAACVAALYFYLLNMDTDVSSPWFSRDGWRLNHATRSIFCITEHSATAHDHAWLTVEHQEKSNQYQVSHLSAEPEQTTRIMFDTVFLSNRTTHHSATTASLNYNLNETQKQVSVVASETNILLTYDKHEHSLTRLDADTIIYRAGSNANDLRAPMPGKVIDVLVKKGEKVAKNQPLMILEAMKMEHTILAPFDGELSEVFYKVNDRVDANARLIAFTGKQDMQV